MNLHPLLTPTLAASFADCALHCIHKCYPYAMPHLMQHAEDRPDPARVHPLFSGSYDWHSSVHMHWSLLRLLRLMPDLPQAARIVAHFEARFTREAGAIESAYLRAHVGFERPYGWAWLLQLHGELLALAATVKQATAWADALQEMIELVVPRSKDFLRLSHYPQRAGMHANSAFAMTLFSAHAQRSEDQDFALALREASQHWFGADRRYPARYEPSGADFLSGGLCEAVLMASQLGADFETWWKGFAPSAHDMRHWLKPAQVSSRVDAQLVHLDGLNLSRAWCLQVLAARLPGERVRFQKAADLHLKAALPHVTGGDFVATHWLVSFALLALSGL